MTPAVLQALAPAVAAGTPGQAAPAAPRDASATFADALAAQVQALAGAGEPQAAAAPEAVATDQPRLDAMAMMLAAALPAANADRRAATVDGQASITVTLDVTGQATTSAGERTGRDADEPEGAAAPETLATGQTLVHAVAVVPGAAPARPGHGTPRLAAGIPGAGPQALAAAPAATLAAPVAAAPAGPRAAAASVHPPARPTAGARATPPGEVPEPEGNGRQAAATAAAVGATLDMDVGAPTPPAAREVATAAPAVPPSAGPGTQRTQSARDVAAIAAAPLATPDRSPAAAPGAPTELAGEPAAPSAISAPAVELVATREASPVPPQAPPVGAPPALATAVATAPGTPAHVAPPVGSPDWAPALAQQIVRLPGGGEVELHLNPAELGPLQVKLTLVESQAQVVFVAEHAAVRQALETALPQLRASFSESGINLGQATVGSGAGEQRTGQDGGERPGRGERPAAPDESAAERPHGAPVRSARAGAVDTFA